MKLDGLSLYLISNEINNHLIPAQIINLYQVEQFGILLAVKKNKEYQNIFFSLKPDLMSLFLSEEMPHEDNYHSSFIKQLRKELQGGILLNIEQIGFDRIVKFTVETEQKFGPPITNFLILEFMGKHSNAILVGNDGIIKTSLKQVGSELNRYREIKAGVLYISPPKQEKSNPITIDKKQFLDLAAKQQGIVVKDNSLIHFLLNNFQGIGQKSAKEILSLLNYSKELPFDELSFEQLNHLWECFNSVKNALTTHRIEPLLLIENKSEKIIDCTLFTSKNSIGTKTKYLAFDSLSSCLEYFYIRTIQEEKKQILFQIINNTLQKNIEKLEEKEKFLKEQNVEIQTCKEYQKKGELILANLWNIENGHSQISLTDYSLANQPRIDIDLNPGLTPLQNAQNYFQKYKKLIAKKKMLEKQYIENQKYLKQLKGMYLTLTEKESSIIELNFLYQKLVDSNLIKEKKYKKKNNLKIKSPSPLKFISPDGWTILLGKNSQQNEYILRSLSSGNDFWLHSLTKPGAHTIIKNHHNLLTPPFETLKLAAKLTGYYSKIKDKEVALIIYTQRKYVKKPKNVKSGKVTYSQEKTLAVTIDHEEIKNDISSLISI